MALTTTKTNVNLGTENLTDVEVHPYIWHVGEPTDSPLITLTGGKLYKSGTSKPEDVPGKIKRESTKEVDYKVIEKDPLARVFTMNGAVADTTTTSFTVVSSANLTGGETVKNITTGEIGYVQTVTNTTTLVVARNLGSTTYQVGASDVWKVVGYAGAEGSAKRSMKSQLASPRTRYCQVFKRSFGVTGTAMKVKLVSEMDAWSEEQTQALANHKKDIEFSFWMNPGADSTTDASSNTVYLTRGILAELGATRTENCDSNLTEDSFFGEVCQNVFQYGPSRKTLFADGALRSKINSWSRVKQQTAPSMTKYGLNVQTLDTGHGFLDIIACGVYDNFLSDDDKGFGVVLDLSRIAYRFIEGRDSMLELDIQTPGTDAREGQYISECGISVRSLDHHRIINNIQ